MWMESVLSLPGCLAPTAHPGARAAHNTPSSSSPGGVAAETPRRDLPLEVPTFDFRGDSFASSLAATAAMPQETQSLEPGSLGTGHFSPGTAESRSPNRILDSIRLELRG